MRFTRLQRNATDLYLEWKTAGLGSDQHLLARYHDGENPSWTLGYNLFADKWLGLGLVEESVCIYIGFFYFIPDYSLGI